MSPAHRRHHRTFAPLAVLLILISILRCEAAEIPPALWATFVTGTNMGMAAPKILANPSGGFYVYSSGDRPLIKINSDKSIAWEIRFERGVNDVLGINQLDLLDNGDLIALAMAGSNPRLFGQQFTADGTYLVQLRASDSSAVFVKASENCAVTAVKARPGGGYFLAGYSWGAPRIGGDQLPLTTPQVFLSQFTSGHDWTLSGGGNTDPVNYRIEAIRTASTATLRIFAAGTAPGPWTFGGKPVTDGGAYLVTADITGQAVNAQVMATNGGFAAMETTPGGRLHFAANSNGGNLIRRIEPNGSAGWMTSVTNAATISGITATDEPIVIGSSSFTITTALDSAGKTKWQRIEASRSDNTGVGIAMLNDGTLAISGAAHGSGLFIDDFFLKNSPENEISLFGAFIATLETRSAAPPVFRVQPRHQKFTVRGETLTLHSEVYSPSPATFAWFKNGVQISGQTIADLAIPAAQATDSGTYFVEARNTAGVTRSSTVEVVVNSITVSALSGSDAAGVFQSPRNPITLPDGSILVADTDKNVIKRVNSSGITILAGTGQPGLANGSPLESLFSGPTALAFESRHFGPTVFVADRGNSRVRRIRLSVQTGEATSVDDVSYPFPSVNSIAALEGAPFFIAASMQAPGLWKSDANSTIDFSGAFANGVISALAIDVRGNVYLADTALNEIRRKSPGGEIQHIATIDDATGIAMDDGGNLFVTERASHAVRKISPAGLITPLIVEGLLNAPEGLCFRGNSLIVADTGNHSLREIKFEPAQTVVTGTAKISATVGSSLRLSITGSVGEQYAIESSPQVGPTASWQTEGAVSIGQEPSDVLLPKPTSSRFYRARKLQ